MSKSPSNLQVLVKFDDNAVFAGEELKCIITFRNTAILSESVPPTPRHFPRSRQGSISGVLPSPVLANGAASRDQYHRQPSEGFQSGAKGIERGHKATASLSIPLTPAVGSRSPSWTQSTYHPSQHQRSLSIISAGSPVIGRTDSTNLQSTLQDLRRPSGHARAASLAIVTDSTAPSAERSSNVRTPSTAGLRPSLRQPSLSRNLSPPGGSRSSSPSASASVNQRSGAKQALVASTSARGKTILDNDEASSGKNTPEKPSMFSQLTQATTIVSSASATEDRPSIDLRSSNHSQETLASEHNSLFSERVPALFPVATDARIRQHYHMDPPPRRRPRTEKLLMGYAQILASFTLDNALVEQSHFDEVKKKGFVGGQAGGGVIGVKAAPKSGGFLGGLNLNSLQDSIGGLLGQTDMSSTKGMRDITSSRAIPLLSTSQSLLFVDLDLAPGAERSFSFSYILPRGLPSSHKGKAIKIGYNLNVGVQAAPGRKDVQAMRQVSIPFRVFSGVDPDGDIFGHDMMQPHVILQDGAKTEDLGTSVEQPKGTSKLSVKVAKSAEEEFLAYVDGLLDTRRRRQSSSGTIDQSFRSSVSRNIDKDVSAVSSIARAIAHCNQVSTANSQSPNRFEIARASKHIAVIILNRPLHRLGESIQAIIDFSGAYSTKCYSVRCSLETAEKVNPALALRSAASITRMTKKVHARALEMTLFSRRAVFNLAIPISATPTLLTSGINLDWALRFEFSMVKEGQATDKDASDENEEGHAQPIIYTQAAPIMRESNKDDRGITYEAISHVDCENFEVVIPITVYGDLVVDLGAEDDSLGYIL